MKGSFRELMAEKPYAEVLRIAASSEDEYQLAAIEAARAEVARRHLTPEQIEAATRANEADAAAWRARADEPLEEGWKLGALLFPGLLNLLFASSLRDRGYARKAKEVSRYTLRGCLAYVGLLLLVLLASYASIR